MLVNGVQNIRTVKYRSMFSYQILQLDEDDHSVGVQYFLIVTSTFATSVGQQQNHQDTTE